MREEKNPGISRRRNSTLYRSLDGDTRTSSVKLAISTTQRVSNCCVAYVDRLHGAGSLSVRHCDRPSGLTVALKSPAVIRCHRLQLGAWVRAAETLHACMCGSKRSIADRQTAQRRHPADDSCATLSHRSTSSYRLHNLVISLTDMYRSPSRTYMRLYCTASCTERTNPDIGRQRGSVQFIVHLSPAID